jgi:hypothetical protein
MDTQAQTDPAALEAEGWTRRFVAIGVRLSEAVELYRALGFELRLEPADTADGDDVGTRDEGCAQCVVMTLARTIYTRRPPTAGGEAGQKGEQA